MMIKYHTPIYSINAVIYGWHNIQVVDMREAPSLLVAYYISKFQVMESKVMSL